MVTAFITHPALYAHEMPHEHPECSRRLAAIEDQLHVSAIYDLLQHHEAPRATRAQIERVHTPRLIDELSDLSPSTDYVPIDPDTFMGTHTLEAAWRAAGAAVLATTLVVERRVGNAFCAVRPPGHHAEHDRAMGFCFFNNVAVAAAHALEMHGLERVAVLDFDVHHGNGTENIFADDDRVLICSTFQHPLYPFSSFDTSSKHIVNTPLPSGTGSDAYRAAVSQHWIPALDSFRPEMIFVSAGFDAHLEDPLAELMLVDEDYVWLTKTIAKVADRHASGRIVSCLEGGYALQALGRCVSIHVRALAGL